MKPNYLLLLLILFIVSSCESYNQDDYREIVVVESFAVANRTLPNIRVSTTSPSGEKYNFADNALTNANVQVVLLDEENNTEELFSYFHSSFADGIYVPASNHVVQPRRTYRLDIDFDERDEIITAETTIPDQFSIINDVRDSTVYQSVDQIEVLLSATERTQNQNVFVFNAISLKPDIENLTPFYRGIVDDGNSDLEDFISNSSGLINEGNFDINPDGTILLRFPWIGIAFFEENLIITNSVDKNVFDLIRSQEVQFGGSTLPPGEIPNLIYNVEGGIGVFGSLSSDTVQTYFKRP